MSKLRLLENFLWNDDVTLTASSENSEFPVSNLKQQIRSKVWRTTSTSSQSVIIDLKSPTAVDSLGVVFREEKPIRLSSSATIRLEGNATANFASPALSTVLSLDDDNQVITHFYSSDENYRYWRLFIDDPVSPYTDIEISNIVLAKSLAFDGPDIGVTRKVNDVSNESRTQYGQRYFDIRPNIKAFDFDLKVITEAEFESIENLFDRTGYTEVLGVAIDPLETVFDKDRFFLFGTLQKNLEIKQRFLDNFDTKFSVTEQL